MTHPPGPYPTTLPSCRLFVQIIFIGRIAATSAAGMSYSIKSTTHHFSSGPSFVLPLSLAAAPPILVVNGHGRFNQLARSSVDRFIAPLFATTSCINLSPTDGH